jgi:hypothetical protein
LPYKSVRPDEERGAGSRRAEFFAQTGCYDISQAHIGWMKNLAIRRVAFASAAPVAFTIAYLTHTVLGVPRYAIRVDALGLAACLAVFLGAAMFAQRRG